MKTRTKVFAILFLIFLLVLQYIAKGQTIPRISQMMLDETYDVAFQEHYKFMCSEEGKDLVFEVYTEAGMWIVLPEVRLGKIMYDAFKLARYASLTAKLSEGAIRVFKIGGISVKLFEGGSRRGFVHILQRHAPMVSGLVKKGTEFTFGHADYVLKLMEKFVGSNPILINTWKTGKRTLLTYKASIKGVEYVMIVDKTNRSVHTFYPLETSIKNLVKYSH